MGKTALVTGASRGIGSETARQLAKNGYDTVLNYNNSQKEALALRDELRAYTRCVAVRADVSNYDQVCEMAECALAQLGPIDLLVNNAGISQQGLLTDLSPREWRRLMAVNLDGAFHCSKALLPSMLARKSGCIINISSMWAQTGASCEVAYSAAKAGLIGFSKALAKEVGPSGIRVNCIAPGMILTDMNAAHGPQTLEVIREETPLGMLGVPADIAKAVVFLAGDGAGFITGQVLGVNGGLVI